jgi:hypothetical protein
VQVAVHIGRHNHTFTCIHIASSCCSFSLDQDFGELKVFHNFCLCIVSMPVLRAYALKLSFDQQLRRFWRCLLCFLHRRRTEAVKIGFATSESEVGLRRIVCELLHWRRPCHCSFSHQREAIV